MEKADVLMRKIEDAGLAIRQSDCWRGIPYCWADYTINGEGTSSVIAKYLFTFTDAEEWNVLFSSREEFISDCIIPCFFAQNGDISWNLYWISVLEQEQLERLDVQKRILFSGNTEYTRNFLAPLEHLQDSVPAGRVPLPTSAEYIPMPGEDWFQQLDPWGMAFCLDKYSSSALDAYIQGDPVESREDTGSVSETAAEQRIRRLCSVSIPKSFRPHYYQTDWDIPFAPVNLLYGSNGSGKTSLLSAVELGITGEVRNPDLSTNSGLYSNIVIAADIDGTLNQLRPPRIAAEKKRLERQWYKSRSDNRSGVQLNNLFHRFNYLSVEETFMFANQQPDLSDIFSKILYGPETDEMWKNCSRYLDECARMLNSCENEARQYSSRLEDMDESQTTDMAALRAYLSASGLSFRHAESAAEIMHQVQTILAEYDKVSGLGPVVSSASVHEQIDQLTSEVKQCEDDISELTSWREEIRAQRIQLNEETLELETQKQRIFALSKELRETLSMFRFYCDHRKSIYKYQSLAAQSSYCDLRIKQLRSVIDDCGSALKMPIERSASEIHEEMKQLQARYSQLRQRRDELAEQISALELSNEQRAQLLASLHSAALEFYRRDKKRCTCPLCGAQGVTSDSLKRHIDSETSQSSRELTELYRRSEEVDNDMKAIASRLKHLDALLLSAMEYESALDALRQRFPGLGSYNDLCEKYEQARKEFNTFQAGISRVESELMAELAKESADSNSLQPVFESRNELLDLLKSCDVVLPDSTSDQELLNSATELRSDFANRLQDIDARFRQIDERTAELKNSLGSCVEDLKMARKDIARTKRELMTAEKIAAFWDRISALCTVPDMDGESLQPVCLRILGFARDVIDSEKRKMEKARLKNEMQFACEKAERCQALKTALEKLRPPEEYADDFIKQNVEQVRRIFLALHSPQEFSHLDISNNELVAFRGEDAVPVERMSTGQRAALVIAVFFQMNFACPHAPNFLLMDEPVANIDDLNVLAMLDFLRELVICRGTQLFFTTANRNIAKLFRRKFSFMGTSFQELDFLRENENSLTIKQQFYDQSRVVSCNIL